MRQLLPAVTPCAVSGESRSLTWISMFLARSSIAALWLVRALVRVQRSLVVSLVVCRTSSGRASSKTLSSACSSPVAFGRGAPLRPPSSVLRRVSPSSSLTLSSGASGRGAELGRSTSALQGAALRARDVRGCSGLVNSDGMTKPPGGACSKGSSAVVMHGHRMCSDIDLDSVFVPHSRSFSLCSSVVSKVSCSSQSINSCGEHGSALGHKNSCNSHGVQGGTKALSTSTRCKVGRLAEKELGMLRQGLQFSMETEIVPGCAVAVARPSCPVSPGPGRIIWNMFGWSQLERTVRSGVWLFPSALHGESLFSSLDAAGGWGKWGSVPCDSSCTCSYANGQGPATGPHTGERCWPLLSHTWCAEGEVPTAANLNLYQGWRSCVCWHRDDKPLFGEYGEATQTLQSSDGGVSPVRMMKATCVGLAMVTCSFIVRIPGRELERIHVTFRWIWQHIPCGQE